jgi:MFS superfamily sulfate permease-like transporter
MVLSLLRLIQHSYHPHTGVMVPDVNKTWKVVPPAPGALTVPGLVLYRFGAALFYANAGRFADEILALAGSTASAVRWVIVDAEAITNIDFSASRVIAQLKKHLDEMDVTLGFARLSRYSKADFDRHHLTEAIGPSMIFDRLHNSLESFEGFRNSLFAQSSPIRSSDYL